MDGSSSALRLGVRIAPQACGEVTYWYRSLQSRESIKTTVVKMRRARRAERRRELERVEKERV